MNDSLIECRNLSKRFGSVLAVDSVDLEVWTGEIVSILGASGCGKTTLLRLIAGFETPSDGVVRIRGEEVSGPNRTVPPDKRAIGMVVQEYALFPHMTLERNISFGLQALDGAAKRARVEEVLRLVQLEGLEGRYPSELSGGQQQRAALARTLAPNPVTALLDEPFSNIDSSMRQRLRSEVEGILRAQRTAAMFVTHDREEAFAMADRVGVMVDGRMLQIDTPEQVYHFPASEQAAGLTGTCDFIAGTARADGGLDTAIGVIEGRAATGDALSSGERVRALLRPDDLELIPDRKGEGTVASREFRGDEVILSVALDSGETVRSRRRSHSRLPAGTRVRVSTVKAMPFAAYRADFS